MTNVIVICPCCASPVDAQDNQQQQCLVCLACGQTWFMRIDAERQKEYALT